MVVCRVQRLVVMLCIWSMPMLLHAFLVPIAFRGSVRSPHCDSSMSRANFLNMQVLFSSPQFAGCKCDVLIESFQNVEVEGRHEVLLSRTQFARRTMACKIYSRMLNRVGGQSFSQGLGSYGEFRVFVVDIECFSVKVIIFPGSITPRRCNSVAYHPLIRLSVC